MTCVKFTQKQHLKRKYRITALKSVYFCRIQKVSTKTYRPCNLCGTTNSHERQVFQFVKSIVMQTRDSYIQHFNIFKNSILKPSKICSKIFPDKVLTKCLWASSYFPKIFCCLSKARLPSVGLLFSVEPGHLHFVLKDHCYHQNCRRLPTHVYLVTDVDAILCNYTSYYISPSA